MFEYTKLISKKFLKQGKVTELLKLEPDCETSLLNEVQLMESLLEHPQHSDNAQKRLTHLVYKYMDGFFESDRQNPENFVLRVLHDHALLVSPKLISKEFLKQGKVSEMFSVNPNCDASLLNRAKELESLLDDPEKSDDAQQQLSELVNDGIKAFAGYLYENPEQFVLFLFNFYRQS